MAEYYFSLRSFGMKLKKSKDHNPDDIVLPEGITKERADRFLRVMRAESLDDIKDISDEEIVEMVKEGDKLASIIDGNNILSPSNGLFRRLESYRSTMKRRVL